MPAFVSLALVVFHFLVLNFFKATLFLVSKAILKINDSKTNDVVENIDKASANLNQNIKSVRSGILELSSFFGIILIALVFSYTIDIKYDNDTQLAESVEIEINQSPEKKSESEPQSEPVPEPQSEPVPEPVEPQSNFPARGTKAGQTRCDSNGYRIDTLHDGNGGTYRRKVYDTNYCPIPNSTSSTTTSTSTSQTSSNGNSSFSNTQYQKKKSLNGHYYYTDTKDGINLLIFNRKNLKEWEIEYYKNGTERASFNIKGSISSFYYSKKLNTIVTNRYLGTFDRKHVLNLDLTGNRSVTSGGIETTLGLANDWIKIQHRRN